MADFEKAVGEVKPAFGAVTDTLEAYRTLGIIDSGDHYRHNLATCKALVEQVQFFPKRPFPVQHLTYVVVSLDDVCVLCHLK